MLWLKIMWFLKCVPLQLLASVATWLGKCHTWRRARRSSSGWRTRPWERPSDRGQGCPHSSEHRTHPCDTVCFYLPPTPWQVLCSPPQSQRCSVRAEWSRHPVIWNHVPASTSPKPEKLQSRITRPNGQIGWLQHSRQVADKMSFLPLLDFR